MALYDLGPDRTGPRRWHTISDRDGYRHFKSRTHACRAFRGITRAGRRFGVGARDPKRPRETLETNVHEIFQVYAPNAAVSDQDFQALRFELQEALVEGQVLIEREDVLLL